MRKVKDVEIIDPAEFERLPGAGDGVRPWWPGHPPPHDLARRDGPGGDALLRAVAPGHWVGVWRTAAVADHESPEPDLAFRNAAKPGERRCAS